MLPSAKRIFHPTLAALAVVLSFAIAAASRTSTGIASCRTRTIRPPAPMQGEEGRTARWSRIGTFFAPGDDEGGPLVLDLDLPSTGFDGRVVLRTPEERERERSFAPGRSPELRPLQAGSRRMTWAGRRYAALTLARNFATSRFSVSACTESPFEAVST